MSFCQISIAYFIQHNGNLLYTAMLIARSNGVVVTKFMQKEAAALITKAAEIEWVREKMLAVRRLFFFCRHAAIIMFFYFTKLSNSCEFVSTNFLIVLSLLRITFKHGIYNFKRTGQILITILIVPDIQNHALSLSLNNSKRRFQFV